MFFELPKNEKMYLIESNFDNFIESLLNFTDYCKKNKVLLF